MVILKREKVSYNAAQLERLMVQWQRLSPDIQNYGFPFSRKTSDEVTSLNTKNNY